MRGTGYVSIDDSTALFYETAGTGALTLILVPGWTMSTEVFHRQLDHFEYSDVVRAIAYDPRSQGRSTKTDRGNDYRQHGRDLQRLIEVLGIESRVLCGWSFGTLGVLAQINQFGSDGVEGLIMLDGPPRAASENPDREWATYRYDDADGQQAFYTWGRLRDPAATNRRFAEWMLECPEESSIRWLLGITEQMPDTAAALLNATSVFMDYTNDLIALDREVPLLYLMRDSEGDRVSRWAATHTPTARVVSFGTHLMFHERPEQTNRVLDEFVGVCLPDEDA